MNQKQAIEELQSIRLALSISQSWCCFHAATIGFTGVTGLLAAFLQPLIVKDALSQPLSFAAYWSAVATLNLCIVFIEIFFRERRATSVLWVSQSRAALGQFMPSIAIGAIATIAILSRSIEYASLLPGLWCLFFACGIFASLKQVPASLGWVALYYATIGAFLCLGENVSQLQGWTVGASFGVGQLLSAWIVWREQMHEGR